jgi:hypothetical protein
MELHCWPHAQWTWTLFPKTPILLRRKEEKRIIGTPAHVKSIRFQLTVKIWEFLPEGSGTGFLHKKRVPDIFPLPAAFLFNLSPNRIKTVQCAFEFLRFLISQENTNIPLTPQK